jgi:predicted lactoylglutathione lyase
MRPRISVCNLGVQDLARSRAFYEGLGFVARPESSERAVFFQLEWSWLSLFPRERLAAIAGVASPEGCGFPGFCFSHNVRRPEEVDAILELASSLGGTIAVPAADTSHGRIGYFADPDGFRWEVAYTPRWHELAD